MTKALIGAGCFWGIEEYFRKLTGIESTSVGYSGGDTLNPTYEEVCQGNTNHAEVVMLNFDEKIISYKQLLEKFWKCHDATQLNRQGPDVGSQYRSVIFYFNDNQKFVAEQSKQENQLLINNLIVTEISEVKKFYLAEDYHQRYIEKTGLHCHI